MKNNQQLVLAGLLFQILIAPGLLQGQLPNPRLQRIYPCSMQRGSQVEVNVSGVDLDEATELIFNNPKITGKVKMNPASEFAPAAPVAGQFVVNVPADVSPGIYEARTYGRFGLSNSRYFVVSDTPEAVCNDQNKTPESAAALAVDSSICGRIPANGLHYFKFSLNQNEKVTIECMSRLLDSKMDPVLVISDLNGKEIARGRSTTEENATILFKAPITSQYILSVRDAVFSGSADYFYRLSITKKPYLITSRPILVQENAKSNIELVGWNLPGGKEENGIETLSVATDQVLEPDEPASGSILSPNSYALRWKNISLRQQGQKTSNSIPLFLTRQAVVVENPGAEFTTIKIPCDISGHFSPGNEMDEYRFTAKKGEVFQVEAYSHRLGKNTDIIVMVQQQTKDGQGTESWKNVVVLDDPGDRAGGLGPDFTITTDDPNVEFLAPADGTYRIVLKDQFGTYDFDPLSNYWLSIRKPTPDFNLVCHPHYGHAANGNQVTGNSVALPQDGRARVRLQVARLDGFVDPISIVCEGLPPGVTCETTQIPGRQSIAQLVFYAKAGTPAGKSLVRIYGKAKIGDQEVTKEATYCCVAWDTGNKTQISPSFRRTSNIELSVVPQDEAAATVQAGQGNVLETSIGGKINVPLKLVRRNSFAEPLKLTAFNLDGQLKPADVTIAKDKNEGSVEIFVKDKNVATGEYLFLLQGDAKFKYSRNPQAVAKEESQQKKLEELLKNATAEKTAAAANLDKANKAMPVLDQAIAAAKAAVQTQTKLLQDSANQAAALEKQIQAAKAAKQPKVGNVDLPVAEKQLADLKSKASNRAELTKAEQSLKDAEKAKADGQKAVETVQAQIKTIDDKVKKLTAAVAESKKQVDQLKKQSAPKDLLYVAVSNPLMLRVVASPIAIEEVKEIAATVESTATSALKVQRKYGFADAVNLAFKGPAGVEIKPISIAKDKSDGSFSIVVSKACAPGTHNIEVTATAKFNNVDVKTTSNIKLQVKAK